jgi:choline dehydrogenase-like flavoprotein
MQTMKSKVMAAMRNPSRLLDFINYRNQLGIMVKIGDERRGFISMDGAISKPLSDQDRFRLNRGAAIGRRILIRAGCDPRSIIVGPVRGAHPGATARIGALVDQNLETEIKNLFVADASVIPEALDRPVALTVISLAKRLAERLSAVFSMPEKPPVVLKRHCREEVSQRHVDHDTDGEGPERLDAEGGQVLEPGGESDAQEA